VGIGATLTQARTDAGLSITEVSQRTRIREAIIRGIERDDYAACGGDFYARGHIRAMAKVVGTDPVPLIAEYDAALAPPDDPGVVTAAGEPGQAGPEPRPAGTATGPAARPPAGYRFEARRPPWTPILAVALLVAIGVLIYLLASGAHGLGSAAGAHHGGVATARHGTASPRPAGRHRAIAAAVPLPPASVVAFGPGGTGQGDAPQTASLAIDGNPSTAWHSDWYTTANFGGLQAGTGLLLDMGHPVAVSSTTVVLGAAPGGALQLRAGDLPSLASLPPVAQAADRGGAVTLHVSKPARARYVLIWLTRLPPDGSGSYEAFVYDVTVRGAP
jgi:hypothetical protein